MSTTNHSMETRCVHAGEPVPRYAGAVSLPIFQSSTFENEEGCAYDDLKYIRLNNTPNHKALHEKLAALENTEAALVTASGMAAISTALLSVLKSGDHFLAQSRLYGGTFSFVAEDLPRWGIEVSWIDGDDPASWQSALRPNTKAIYVEAMTNPLLEVMDLEAAVGFARENALVSLIDSTFTTPFNFKPAEMGFDLILHSATKYLNGHSDIVAGVIAGRSDLIKTVLHTLNHLGGSLDPHAAFLFHRGLKTLAVRMERHNANGLALARWLAHSGRCKKIYYPGIETHASHERARRYFSGYSGMLAFEPKGGAEVARAFIEKVRLPIIAPSLGGVETLVTRPAFTSHAGLTPEQREAQGITDSLIRVSVGIESVDDLIADFYQALPL
ncbi:aminotransferase class I/II-fold pyridoxal phosphate-dependent enzyme [bacterium]|nr:aminotransferase class I/II-fold pyridoxal phosphate-dependent enzyme [bacterium]